MDLTITFCRQTVKTLKQHLHAAFRSGNLPQIKRISALLMLADQQSIAVVTDRLGVGRSTGKTVLNRGGSDAP
ncbi:MAG: helix-turn-helix domain-containing protein [Chloroflexi bacterium]|nr:helix-turn-helix domain-containing protein [Chloroflexota bacterium]